MKPRKPGRRKLKASERSTALLKLRLTCAELRAIQATAKADGFPTVAAWHRARLGLSTEKGGAS